MSKKIIYLLSLLMALSLVFASCKKNAAGTGPDLGGNEPPKNEDNTGGLVGDSGLSTVTDSDELVSDKPLSTIRVFEPNNVDYLRTPVVHVMGSKKNVVAVFGERRYKSKGAVNDVGIDGEHAVDVIYNVSVNAGSRFNGINAVGEAATSPDNSRGAPVVFKIDDKTVVIVANSGVGIARTSQAVLSKTPAKLEYIIGTLDETKGTFSWNSWQELKVDGKTLLDIIKAINIPADFGTGTYNQIGTHSAKGRIYNSKLILPVVMADQGSTDTGAKEIMGVYFLEGTYSSGSVTWKKLGNGNENETYFRFGKGRNDTSSYYKETIVISGSSDTDFQYVAIPSGGSKYGLGSYKTSTINRPVESLITGWFGSPDYLTLKWHGSTKYDPTKYDNTTQDQSLFMGSQVDAPDGMVTLYKVQKDTLTINGKTQGHMFNANSKSASMDVLGDGTVIIVSEDGSARELDYYTVVRRCSQKYLASLLD